MSADRAKRRRAQAGTTLVELLVATVIMGLALVLIVGLFASGVVDSTLSKRDVSAEAATQYEMDRIASAPFTPNPSGYSECFGTDGTVSAGTCRTPAGVKADVTVVQVSSGLQQWTITVSAWPAATKIGKPVSVYKASR
jgi:type II secretory pathway pseudopilin PulG